ncbi:MAG TPA: MmgE/PrpD family protein [Chloroflexota bacterium]|nr:MmgE/PrpD family protein [Chloroflexota bacterium]
MDRTLQKLSTYACALSYEDLRPEVVHAVKRTLIDTIGCAIGGLDEEAPRIARQLGESVSGRQPARIWGTGSATSPDMAAFVNGVAVRYLDCNDSYFNPGGGHPSDMIPAILALAEPLGRNGRDVITAIVLAYEVFCRLSDEMEVRELGWDQGMLSVIGAACGAGKILGLDDERMPQAITLAVVPNVALDVTRIGHLTMWKGCATASANRAAVFAAQLAALGMTGPAESFEGKHGFWEQICHEQRSLDAMGGGSEPFRILNTTFKSFPSQIDTQGPIGLALELRQRVAPAEIASIHIDSYRTAMRNAATEPAKWDPQTRETADHSIPYCVAVALTDGEVTPASFTEARVRDPQLRPLLGKMTIEENPDFSARHPREFNCRMTITTVTGEQHVAELRYPLGNARNPLSDADVEAKLRRLAGAALGELGCQAVLERCWALDEQAEMKPLLASLEVK